MRTTEADARSRAAARSPQLVEQLSEHWRSWSKEADHRMPVGYPQLIDELRAFQDDLAAAIPSSDEVGVLRELINDARDLLAASRVDESAQIFGRLLALPGRGQTFSPLLWIDSVTDGEVAGAAEFGRFHLGSNGAVHGGAVALLFDDAVGRAADMLAGGRSRTAYLKVDFRSLTPCDTRLTVRVRMTEHTGRKRFLAAALYDGERLCAEATGLFVELRPDQR